MAAGADAFVFKVDPPDRLLATLHSVSSPSILWIDGYPPPTRSVNGSQEA
jgi:hypothetical protein